MCEWGFQLLDFHRKDLHEDLCSQKDSQKESSEHKAIWEGQYMLQMGELAAQREQCPEATGILSFFVRGGCPGSWIASL